MTNKQKEATIHIATSNRKHLMDKKNKGEIHNTPALSVIGPKIKGIRLGTEDKIKQAIRNLRQKDQAEFDTFEEANDFDVDEEEPALLSGYENEIFEDMKPDTEMEPIAEKQEEEEKSAPEEALKQGADENPTS